MKSRSILFGVLLLGIGQAFSQAMTPPAQGNAVVYFVRLGLFGTAVRFSHFDDGRFIGKFGGSQYLRYECPAGKHLFWAKSGNEDYLPSELEAGSIYFVQTMVGMGVTRAKVFLVPIAPYEVKRIERFYRKIGRKPGIRPSTEALEKATQARQHLIEKNISKYVDAVAEGKQYKPLESNMAIKNLAH